MPETLMDIARSYSTDGSPKRLAREAVIAQVEIVRLIRARVRDLEGENKARQAAILSDTIMVTRLDRLARSTNGIKFGRKPKLTAYQRQEALERLSEGESQSTIARSFNVDRATISRLDRR